MTAPASDPIKERVMADVLSTLRGIDAEASGASYWYTIRPNGVLRADAGFTSTDTMPTPAIVVDLGRSFRVDGSEAANEAYNFEQMDLQLACWLGGDQTSIGTKLWRLEHDIRRALYEDRTRGGLALNTQWERSELNDWDAVPGRAVLFLDFTISVEIKESDLTSTIP